MKTKSALTLLFLLGLIYLLWPGPSSINDFPPLPDSMRSDEPGDTWENPDNAAYFSDFRRPYVVDYYKNHFSYLNIFGLIIPPLSSNHPPEEAFTHIRDQQQSTYLEQFSYPLRDAIFVNGFEPFDEQGKPWREGATRMFPNEIRFYDSKTTIRYYSSSIPSRLIVYILIWISMILLYKLTKKAVTEK